MEHLELSGTPFEMGQQHGQALARLLPDVVREIAPPSPASSAVLPAIEAAVRRHTPDLVEEMRGIAAGAQVPIETVLRLNVIYDALGDALHAPTRCTAIGLPNTAEGPLVAKTDDVSMAERPFEAFFHLRPKHGCASLCYAYAGTVWNHGGLNAAGLAIAMTGLPPIGPRSPDGLPSLLFLRQALVSCATVAEVLALAEAHPLRGYGCSLTMADLTSGDITLLENTPARRVTRRESDQPTVRTNHPQCAETLTLIPDARWWSLVENPELPANSRARSQNARRLAGQVPHSTAGLKQLLSDHTRPGAICQHGAAGLHTSIAMILIPRQRALVAAEGYGCGAYVEYAL